MARESFTDIVRSGTNKSAFEDNVGAGGADWTRIFLAADFVNATVAFNTITGFSVVIPANTDFVLEADILLSTVAAANLPRLGWNWSAALVWGTCELEYQSTATAKIFANGFNLTAAGNLQMPVGSAPVGPGVYGAKGYFKGRTGAAAVTVNLQLAAETAAANAVTAKAKSELRYRSGF